MSEDTPNHSSKQIPTVEEALSDWDGVDLVEGLRLLARYYPCHSLRDSLLLTHIVEEYQQHHKLKTQKNGK